MWYFHPNFFFLFRVWQTHNRVFNLVVCMWSIFEFIRWPVLLSNFFYFYLHYFKSKLGPQEYLRECSKDSAISFFTAAAAAKSLQSCLTLCDPTDGSPPGSAVPGILQARTLEWAAISFSNAWKWKVKGKSLSRVRLAVTPWTAAY